MEPFLLSLSFSKVRRVLGSLFPSASFRLLHAGRQGFWSGRAIRSRCTLVHLCSGAATSNHLTMAFAKRSPKTL